MNKTIVITSILFVIFILSGFIISDINDYSVFSASILYFLFSFFYVNAAQNKRKRFALIVICYISIYIIVFFSLALMLGMRKFRVLGNLYYIYYFVILYAGYRIALIRKLNLKIISIFSVLLFTYLVSITMPYFIVQKNSYGSLNGNANYYPKDFELEFYDFEKKRKISLKNSDDKIYVLDFWNNNCGTCFVKFPKLDNLKKKHNENKNIEFFAVNSYRKDEEIIQGQKMFDSLNYGFKTIFQKNNVSKSLKNSPFYPEILVLKNNKIIYKGSVEMLSILDFYYLKD